MKICHEITKFYELEEHYQLPEVDDTRFCYAAVITNTQELHSDVPVAVYLSLLVDDGDDDWYTELITFSVTSEESRFQEWLDAISSVPGHSITPVKRNVGLGGERTCYYCVVPTTFDVERI